MDKKKFEVMILVILLAFGLNYAIHSYYIEPQNAELKAAEQNYNSLKNQVRELRFKEQDIKELKERVDAKLKEAEQSSELPDKEDNQKLIREFYEACIKYGVQGESLNFSPQGAPPQLQGSEVEGSSEDNNTKSEANNIKSQIITFTFNGEKAKVEKFLEDIRTISSRKLFVSSINITSLNDTGVSIFNTEDTAGQPVAVQVTLMEFLYSEDNAAMGN